jgi:hypothetical protein
MSRDAPEKEFGEDVALLTNDGVALPVLACVRPLSSISAKTVLGGAMPGFNKSLVALTLF